MHDLRHQAPPSNHLAIASHDNRRKKGKPILLFNSILYYSVLFYAILFYIILLYSIQSILFYSILCNIKVM